LYIRIEITETALGRVRCWVFIVLLDMRGFMNGLIRGILIAIPWEATP